MVTTSTTEYVPGTCNIGPTEIQVRRRTGWIALFVTFVLLILLLLTHAPVALRLILFFPSTGAAVGFLQAQLKFCANFGLFGVFNFSAQLGNASKISDPKYRYLDLRKALQIIGISIIIGIIITLISLIF
jgi:hypothetical protein